MARHFLYKHENTFSSFNYQTGIYPCIMIHCSGPFDEEGLIKALAGFLPYTGDDMQSYDVQYKDDTLGKCFIANFIWINKQWVYVDSREDA